MISDRPPEIVQVPEGLQNYIQKSTSGDQMRVSSRRLPNHYWVTDLCGCLRRNYYRISGTPTDTVAPSSTGRLWSILSGRYLHNLTYAYRWRELDIEKKFFLPDIDEMLHVHGRLDMYDYKSETIIDLKTTNAVKWQQEKGLLPRTADVDQIQCYGSLFRDIIKVSDLTLLYADMKDLLPYRIPLVDKEAWITERVSRLHIALEITKFPPAAEISNMCDYCQFRQRCQAQLDREQHP